MADVVNKQTLQYLKSVNTPDYSEDEWLINPDIPKCSKKYWKIKDCKIVEMTQTEKDNVDSVELPLPQSALDLDNVDTLPKFKLWAKKYLLGIN